MIHLRVVGEQQSLSGLGTWLHGAGHARNTIVVPVFDNVHAVSQMNKAGGALAVLGINVAMLLVGGTATLAFQRWLERRREGERA
jgi:hypothetical protein